MVKRSVLDEPAVPVPEDFDPTEYSRKVFEMYSGEEVRVRLECKDHLMKYVIDRFGMDVDTEPSNGETFIANVDVKLSPTFYGWVFRFKGDIKIIEPDNAVSEMREMAQNAL